MALVQVKVGNDVGATVTASGLGVAAMVIGAGISTVRAVSTTGGRSGAVSDE